LHLVGPEAKLNTQLYSAAQAQDQAALLYELMAKIVRMSPDLAAVVTLKDSTYTATVPEIGTVYKALSKEKSTAYGKSPIFVVHDELGQVVGPRSQLFEALETAQAAHEEPMSIIISTQAPTDADLLSLLIDDAATARDPRTKLFLYTAPMDANPFTKTTIKKANPAFDHFMNQQEVLDQAQKAKHMPSREADYRNLVLNQRVNRNDPFVSAGVWKANGKPVRPADFEDGIKVGLDLSERNDLTALIYTGKGKDGATSVGCEFYAPKEGIGERSLKDRVPYDLWADRGLLTATPGSTVDYEFVARRLIELHLEHGIQVLHFDRWRMKYLRKELERLGVELPLEDHGQGYVSMAPALDALEADLLNRRLRHGNHPDRDWETNS